MKEILVIAIAAGVIFGIASVSVEQFGDRELFVSPPDAVAEAFVREIVTRRWSPAREYLTDPSSAPDSELAVMQQSIESKIGHPTRIEAETLSRSDNEALVTVRLSSARREMEIPIRLRFDGDWTVKWSRR